MKKSGTTPISPSRADAGLSVDVLIPPACHEVLPQIVAERDDLSFEAGSERRHEGLVDLRRGPVQHALVDRPDQPAARIRREQRLQGPLEGLRAAAVTHRDGMEKTVQAC